MKDCYEFSDFGMRVEDEGVTISMTTGGPGDARENVWFSKDSFGVLLSIGEKILRAWDAEDHPGETKKGV